MFKRYAGRYAVIFMLILLLVLETYAGDPHAMWGYCRDGHDKTSAVGSEVYAYIEGKETETIIAVVGNNHEYLIDASGFSRWNSGDVVVIEIRKGQCYANRKVILNAVGAQRIPDLALTCPDSDSTNTEAYVERLNT